MSKRPIMAKFKGSPCGGVPAALAAQQGRASSCRAEHRLVACGDGLEPVRAVELGHVDRHPVGIEVWHRHDEFQLARGVVANQHDRRRFRAVVDRRID
jgi:hypothetical protein